MFEDVSKEPFAAREEKTQKFWEDNKIFEESIAQRDEKNTFSFYDGPPFATGLPHYGHLLAGTIKDVVPRYKTMKGYHVPRRFGWDCHGLPVENEIEKAYDLAGADAIEDFGIAKFNEECRSIVLRYTKEWQNTVERMGRWVDFNHTYHTMDITFMETLWWVFKNLYDQGLVYEGFKVMPFSAKLGTPLSNFEAGENYKEVDDPSLTITLPLVDDPKTSLLAWTTTPWTLISNLAATVSAEIEYVKVHDKDKDAYYILAKERLSAYYKNEEDYTIIETFYGEDLKGKKYIPLFDYFKERGEEGAFRVITDDFVSTEDGTGIVHTAPAFGEVDFYACMREDIALVCPVDNNGKFTDKIPEYTGMFVKDADKDIIKRLKAENRVVTHKTIRHRYPFCWRSDTPLVYRAMRSWYIGVEKIKDKLLTANEQTHWTPGHLKKGRFGKWLEGARDWAVSRNRYWGTPIPIWRSDDEEDIIVIGSIEELEKLSGQKITDLHRHYIDDITFTKDGKEYSRISEVFDCWFESGAMPYAQNHYPFENKELVEKTFPADFIAEGLDQTRGWFYTLTVLSAALFDKPAFKNVIVNGILLAEDGNKMSKRLKNYPEPSIVINKYGADAIRLYMLHSPAVRGDDLRFSEQGVELVMRQVMIPLWNAYSFFVTYAKIYSWDPEKDYKKPNTEIDRWILSSLHKLVKDVEDGMGDYDLNNAVEPLVGFVDKITNWYIRRSRRRFWEEKRTPDRDEAFSTLYTVLLELTKVAAPFIPFITEDIFRNLRTDAMPTSVHLCDYPEQHNDSRDTKLEKEMELVLQTVKLGHSLRKQHKLKVRQPLAAVNVVSNDVEVLAFLKHQKHLIADELNVKDVIFSSEEEKFVNLIVKPNFAVLGRKLGKLMKQAQKEIASLNKEQCQPILDGGNVTINLDGEEYTLTAEEVSVERNVREGMVAANAGDITIVLETELDEALIVEGIAREVVNKINTMRRDAKLHVSDRIQITIHTTDTVKKAFDVHKEYITNEVLATHVDFKECTGTPWDINGENTTIAINSV